MFFFCLFGFFWELSLGFLVLVFCLLGFENFFCGKKFIFCKVGFLGSLLLLVMILVIIVVVLGLIGDW